MAKTHIMYVSHPLQHLSEHEFSFLVRKSFQLVLSTVSAEGVHPTEAHNEEDPLVVLKESNHLHYIGVVHLFHDG